MLSLIVNWWRGLKLKNQILILQGLLITLVFISLVTLSVMIIDKFQKFLEKEFILKFLMQSVMSTFNTLVAQTNSIGKVTYMQLLAGKGTLENLYKFQILNNIIMTSSLDNCLERPHTQQFYSYQFCYGVYGNKTDENAFKTIKNYISLQNIIVPLNYYYNDLILSYHNIYLDQQMFYSQFKGEYIKDMNQDMQQAAYLMMKYKLPLYVKQIKDQDGSKLLLLAQFSGAKIASGITFRDSQQMYYKMIKSDEFLNQRQIFMTFSGRIISDSFDLYSQGQSFSNSSLTGFNISQFEKIQKFSFQNQSIQNECWGIFQDEILCLYNSKYDEQLLFTRYIESFGYQYILIVIVDGKSISQIQKQFQDHLKQFFQQQIQLISALFIGGLLLCLGLQLILIIRLNAPLIKLQNVANYHMNMNYYSISRIIRLDKVQSQIQKLSDAFFDLININQKLREEKSKNTISQQLQTQCFGQIQQRYETTIIFLIKYRIKHLANKCIYDYD